MLIKLNEKKQQMRQCMFSKMINSQVLQLDFVYGKLILE